MAEALLRHHLERTSFSIEVQSAGTLGWNGAPATPHTLEVLAGRGVALVEDTCRARSARAGRRGGVDHRDGAHALAWAIAAHDRITAPLFLLDELVRLGTQVGQRGGEMLGAWLAELGALRPPDRLAHASEEVVDPAGEAIEVYRTTAARLDRSVQRLMPLLASSRLPA